MRFGFRKTLCRSLTFITRDTTVGSGEVSQQLITLAALAEDPDHMVAPKRL